LKTAQPGRATYILRKRFFNVAGTLINWIEIPF
jgi:hypothetical protein